MIALQEDEKNKGKLDGLPETKVRSGGMADLDIPPSKNRHQRRAEQAAGRTKKAREVNRKLVFHEMKRRLPIIVERAHKSFDQLQQAGLERSSLTPSCKTGCAACCDQLVLVTMSEALNIATKYPKVLTEVQEEIERHAALVESKAFAGKPRLNPMTEDGRKSIVEACEAWWDLREPCALLDKETKLCRVYDARPIACRSYLVVSEPETCALRPEPGQEIPVAAVNNHDLRNMKHYELMTAESQFLKNVTLGPLPNLLSVTLKNLKQLK